MSSQFQLLRERRFLPFFCTQFLGAFNDNVFKTALITLLTFHAVEYTSVNPGTLATVLPGVFILPFFLFSASAGQFADKFDKAAVARAVKLFEIGIMAMATLGFVTKHLWALVVALFLMGLHSTIFGPVKYSYMPQHLKTEELVGGNGMVEMGTFVAILLGQVLGAGMVFLGASGATMGAVVVGLAVLGWLTSRAIPVSPAADPALKINWNLFTETFANLKFAHGNRTVWLSLLGVSWFWFYGATLLAQFPPYAKDLLGGNEAVFVLLLTFFSIGAGVGSLLCEKLSDGKVEIGLVPFGAIGLTLFGVDLYFASPSMAQAVSAAAPAIAQASGAVTPAIAAAGETAKTAITVGTFIAQPAHWRILFDILMLGTFGGFYIVPLYALIQTRTEKSHQSRVIAANNILNALFMVASAAVTLVLFKLGLDIPQLFLATAIFGAIVAIYICTLVPEFFMRFIVWLLVHTIYRLDARDLDRVPAEGPAVIVCNHASFVDALILIAACKRPIRFVMDHQIFRMPVISFVFRVNRCIPIAPAKEDPALLDAAYEEIGRALDAGELIGIFPEGRVTGDGEIAPFKNGISRILARNPVPVVPMALRGLWGSFFSRKGGPAMSKPFRRGLFNRVTLVTGMPVSGSDATPAALQQVVTELRGAEM